MINFENCLVLELQPNCCTTVAPSAHLAELAREASVAELLQILGAECLEIRFPQPG